MIVEDSQSSLLLVAPVLQGLSSHQMMAMIKTDVSLTTKQ